MGEGSYQELQTSGFDFAKLIGSSEDITIVSDISDCKKHSENFDTSSILSPQSSEESISLFVDETKLNGILTKPKEETECHSYGCVKKSDYISYFFAGGSTCKVLFCLLLYILTQVLITGGDYWISFWYFALLMYNN